MLYARLVLLEQQRDIVRNQFSIEERLSRIQKTRNQLCTEVQYTRGNLPAPSAEVGNFYYYGPHELCIIADRSQIN